MDDIPVTREELKIQLSEIDNKVSKMYYALMGNELTKDGGLIKRIDIIESRLEKHDYRIIKNAEDIKEKNIYVRALIFFTGGLIVYIAEQILSN